MLDVLSELMLFIAPLWLAIIVGLLVGWAWKPKWAKNLTNCSMSDASLPSPTASLSACFASFPSLNALKFQLPNCVSCNGDDKESPSVPPAATGSDCRLLGLVMLFKGLDDLVFENRSLNALGKEVEMRSIVELRFGSCLEDEFFTWVGFQRFIFLILREFQIFNHTV